MSFRDSQLRKMECPRNHGIKAGQIEVAYATSIWLEFSESGSSVFQGVLKGKSGLDRVSPNRVGIFQELSGLNPLEHA